MAKGVLANAVACSKGLQEASKQLDACSEALDKCTNGGDCRVAAKDCKALMQHLHQTLAACRGKEKA